VLHNITKTCSQSARDLLVCHGLGMLDLPHYINYPVLVDYVSYHLPAMHQGLQVVQLAMHCSSITVELFNPEVKI
jgi:hypothetical protein